MPFKILGLVNDTDITKLKKEVVSYAKELTSSKDDAYFKIFKCINDLRAGDLTDLLYESLKVQNPDQSQQLFSQLIGFKESYPVMCIVDMVSE